VVRAHLLAQHRKRCMNLLVLSGVFSTRKRRFPPFIAIAPLSCCSWCPNSNAVCGVRRSCNARQGQGRRPRQACPVPVVRMLLATHCVYARSAPSINAPNFCDRCVRAGSGPFGSFFAASPRRAERPHCSLRPKLRGSRRFPCVETPQLRLRACTG
jgi:hypothetical protein